MCVWEYKMRTICAVQKRAAKRALFTLFKMNILLWRVQYNTRVPRTFFPPCRGRSHGIRGGGEVLCFLSRFLFRATRLSRLIFYGIVLPTRERCTRCRVLSANPVFRRGKRWFFRRPRAYLCNPGDVTTAACTSWTTSNPNLSTTT